MAIQIVLNCARKRWKHHHQPQSLRAELKWGYEPVSDLWPDIEPDSDSINDGSSDEGS